tara:strand:- start:2591 stop:3094 length:504 start_codon:yes stop_codon:yes gene_type:complete
MAKDYLNIIERALMMGLSDKINAAVTGDIFIHGQFPETEDMKFPSLVVQQISSGFEEKFQGEKITFGSDTTSSSGEIYGMSFLIHIIVDKNTTIGIDGTDYKQRRLVNWLMLNIANCIMEIDWSVYEEEELEIVERHLTSWRDIGYIEAVQWYGATAEFEIYFLNKR